MTEYRRWLIPGGTWFFTVNLAERSGSLLVDHLANLRSAIRSVQAAHPFHIDAIVILPEHLHCIWTLPPQNSDISTRWSLIKGQFSRSITKCERISSSRIKRGERGLWQRRFWEHLIRDEEDLNRHTDYIHWNPVKHGWVQRVDWPHSSFHRFVERGVYTSDWGGSVGSDIEAGE
jgi:putative transposase